MHVTISDFPPSLRSTCFPHSEPDRKSITPTSARHRTTFLRLSVRFPWQHRLCFFSMYISSIYSPYSLSRRRSSFSPVLLRTESKNKNAKKIEQFHLTAMHSHGSSIVTEYAKTFSRFLFQDEMAFSIKKRPKSKSNVRSRLSAQSR